MSKFNISSINRYIKEDFIKKMNILMLGNQASGKQCVF